MPGILYGLLATALLVIATTLFDLSRNRVRHLPKWAWAIIIVCSVPLGAIAYATVGRVSPHEFDPLRDA